MSTQAHAKEQDGIKISSVKNASLHTTVFVYLLHDSVHVVFIGHACQLQVDGNIFANVGYGRHGLQGRKKVHIRNYSIMYKG